MNSNTSEWKQNLPKFILEKVNCLEEKLEMLQDECFQKQTQIDSFESLCNENHQIQITKLQQQIVNYDLMNRNAEKKLENSLKYNENLKSNLSFIEQELNSMKNGIDKIECDIGSKENNFPQEVLGDLINYLHAEKFDQVDVSQEMQSSNEVFNSIASYQNSVLSHKSEALQEISKQNTLCLNCFEYESNVAILKEKLMESESKFEELKKYFTAQFYELQASYSRVFVKLSNIVKEKEKEIYECKMKCESTDSSINLKDENMSLEDEECSILWNDFLTTLKEELQKCINSESLASKVSVSDNVSEYKEELKVQSKCEFKNLAIENSNVVSRVTEESSNFLICQINDLISKNNANELIINEKNNVIVKTSEMVDVLKDKLADVEREKMKWERACIQQGLNVEENDLLQKISCKNLSEKLDSENKRLKIENCDLKSKISHRKNKTKKILMKLLDYKHCISGITSMLLSLFNYVDVNNIEFEVVLNGANVQTKSIASFWKQEISIIESELAKHPEIFQSIHACFDKRVKEKQQMEHVMHDIVMGMQEEIREMCALCFLNVEEIINDANVTKNLINFQCNPVLKEVELNRNLLHALSANLKLFLNGKEVLENCHMFNKDILLKKDIEKAILCKEAFENDDEMLKSYEDKVRLMHFDYKKLLKNHLELQIKYEKLKEDLKKNGMTKLDSECLLKSPLKLK